MRFKAHSARFNGSNLILKIKLLSSRSKDLLVGNAGMSLKRGTTLALSAGKTQLLG